MRFPARKKSRRLGPRDGALPDKILAFVSAGVDDLRVIGRELGLTPYHLRQAMRHQCRCGTVSIQKIERVTVHESP